MAAKILNFHTVRARWIKFSEWVDIKNKFNITKIGRSEMGIFPKRDPPKFKLFNLLSWTREIFKVSKYKEKIKFDQILGFENGRSPPNEAAKIQYCLTTNAKQMKF